jgi:hypothetical protein
MYISRKHVEVEVRDLLEMDHCKLKKALIELIMSKLNLEKKLEQTIRQESRNRVALLEAKYAGKI